MLDIPLAHLARRIGICTLALAVGVSTAVVLLLLVSGPPPRAQAADGPHLAPNTARAESLPTGASAQWQPAVKEQLAKEGGVGAASFTPSSVLTLTDAITGSSFGSSVGSAGDVNGDGYLDAIVGASSYLSGTGRVYLYLGSASGLNTTPAFTATGEGTSNRFGFPVGAAGDVNGDGYADVIIGANGYLNNTGRAYVYLGSMNGLSATPAFTVTGDAPANYFGTSVGTAGDVNNDGYDDIVIGAFNYSNGAGRAYVYLGSATGLSSTPAFTATGEGTNNSLGNSAHTAGDVNNDGFDDIVIGAPGYLTYTGRVYLYLGSAVGLSTAPDLTLTGEATNTLFGWSVETAGDVNADTYSDVIVSAPGGEERIYVYLGSAAGLSLTPVFTDFGNIGPNMTFGIAVATAGDVNGDGYDDVVVGGLQFTISKIWAYVYLGTGDGRGLIPVPVFDTGQQSGYASTEGFIGTLGDMNGDGFADIIMGAAGTFTSTGQAHVYYGAAYTPSWSWMVTGDRAESQLGYSVATAGDVNGDSYADVIIGVPGGSPTDTGRIFLYTGSAVGLSLTPTSVLTGGVSDHFGWSAGTAGDVNKDGYADIIVGAWSYNNSTGQAYAYLGSPTGLSATPAFTATGETTNSLFGFSVRTAGDVNKDGYSDIIIGAWGYNNMQGRAYVYLGGASGLNTTPVITLTGENVGDGLGYSVGTAGDVNGDGYADVGIGAPRYGGFNGRAYIYLGNTSGLDAAAIFTATGTRGSGFGWPVATAGDVNGDSYADIVVGEGNTSTIGYAYVHLGAASGLSDTPAFTLTDNVPYSYFGVSAGTAGDVNGDGYDDVIVGAIYQGGGEAYIYLGGTGGLSTVPIMTLTADLPLGVLFGLSAGTAGDVNKDGYADVIVGEPGYQSFYPCCVDGRGRAFLYPGGPAGVDLRLTKAVTPTTATPGQAITYTLTFSNAGIVTATNVVITDLMPAGQVSDSSYIHSGAVITPTPGITYSWQVADLAPGVGGVITITGVLSPDLQAGVFTNTATITSTTAEANTTNNTSAVGVTINLPPVATDDTYTTPEDVSLAITSPGILANDSDPNNDLLTAITLTNPLTGALALSADGAFAYTPTLNFNGVVTFTYQASDGITNSNSAIVTITVTPVNDSPVAAHDAYTVTEDLPLAVAAPGVLANDTDNDGPVSLTAFTVTNPLTGSLALNLDGSFTYTPTLNFTGVVTFTYQANDGLANSNPATVTITVAAAPGSKLYLPLVVK